MLLIVITKMSNVNLRLSREIQTFHIFRVSLIVIECMCVWLCVFGPSISYIISSRCRRCMCQSFCRCMHTNNNEICFSTKFIIVTRQTAQHRTVQWIETFTWNMIDTEFLAWNQFDMCFFSRCIDQMKISVINFYRIWWLETQQEKETKSTEQWRRYMLRVIGTKRCLFSFRNLQIMSNWTTWWVRRRNFEIWILYFKLGDCLTHMGEATTTSHCYMEIMNAEVAVKRKQTNCSIYV